MILNPDKEKRIEIANKIKNNNGYCPCMLEQNEDTICPCKWKREESECICGLYVKENGDDDKK